MSQYLWKDSREVIDINKLTTYTWNLTKSCVLHVTHWHLQAKQILIYIWRPVIHFHVTFVLKYSQQTFHCLNILKPNILWSAQTVIIHLQIKKKLRSTFKVVTQTHVVCVKKFFRTLLHYLNTMEPSMYFHVATALPATPPNLVWRNTILKHIPFTALYVICLFKPKVR